MGAQTSEPPGRESLWAQVKLARQDRLTRRAKLGRRRCCRGRRSTTKLTGLYHRAFAVLGQVRAAQGKFDEAADYYQRAIAVIPLPEYAAALSDVYAKQGRQNDAQQQRELVEFIARLSALNRVLYNRVLVDYYADHDIDHKQAVDLAAGEFKIRKDIYGHDALAWALYRDGKPDAALPHITSALRFKTLDARLYFHAGMIYAALGRNDRARAMLERALAINPHFQPILEDVAKQEYAALNSSNARQMVVESGAHH